MARVKDLYHSYLKKLQDKKILEPKSSLERILSRVLSCNPKDIYFYFDKEVSLNKVQPLIEARLKGIPFEYIVQETQFCSLPMKITPDVLIPRQETELLVELISADIETKENKNLNLFDVCTGSGCIAIALKKRFPSLEVFATDLCFKALSIAKENAKKNRVEIEFLQGDFLKAIAGKKADILVANPPYISLEEYKDLSCEVKAFEPKMALTDGDSGLGFYQTFKQEGFSYLQPKAKVFFEIGYNQKKGLQKLFSEDITYQKKEFLKDLSGKDRFFFLEIE